MGWLYGRSTTAGLFKAEVSLNYIVYCNVPNKTSNDLLFKWGEVKHSLLTLEQPYEC